MRPRFLVPKLCLGTPSAKLRFAPPSMAWEADAKQNFAKTVPKQSLGTRAKVVVLMSYVVHIWQSPVPRDADDAWEIINRLAAQRDREIIPTPPALHQFVERITARYPNWGDLPSDELDDERIVWTDGQVMVMGPILILGICTDWVDRVQPFVVQEANHLGLHCYDMQEGKLYRPAKDLGEGSTGRSTGKRWWQFWK